MQQILESEVPIGALNLLLVTKNKGDFDYLRCLLTRSRSCNIHVRMTSPEEALEHLRSADYDIVFCDYCAGDRDGLRLSNELRRQRSHTPAIFLSDHVNEAA